MRIMNSEIKKSLTIDYAFIIAILTGLLYLLSFLFYAGTFYFYKIPLFLIEVNIGNIISSMIKLSPLVIVIVWATVYTFQQPKRINKETKQVDVDVLSRKHKKNNRSKLIVLLLPIVMLGFAIILYFLENSLVFYYMTGITLGIFALVSRKLYRKKNFVYLTILLYLAAIWLSFGYGYTSASENKKYIIVKEKNNIYVALSVYKDQFVLSPFNMNTKEFSNQFTLKEMKDVNNFKQLKIGVIKLKQ